ncbi:MAG: hypothetical protein ACRDWN_01590 [Acidimicrobiales bacterium]
MGTSRGQRAGRRLADAWSILIEGTRDEGGLEGMGVILVVLLLALVFFGLGFAVHLLWIVAVVLFLAWVAGLAFRRGSTSRRVRR